MANALKKIQARVKKLRKRYPKKKYSSLMKQAGKEFKAGKLKPRRKSAVKKRKPARKKAAPRKRRVARKRAAPRKRTVRRVKRRVARKTTRRTKRRGRVSGTGSLKKMLPVLIIGGVAAYMLLKPKTQLPPIQQTSNVTRNQTASDVLLYAQAAGMTATAIANLINTINQSNDTQVQKIYDNVKTGKDPYANVAGMGSVHLVRSMQ